MSFVALFSLLRYHLSLRALCLHRGLAGWRRHAEPCICDTSAGLFVWEFMRVCISLVLS
jgi:hypothetical protein